MAIDIELPFLPALFYPFLFALVLFACRKIYTNTYYSTYKITTKLKHVEFSVVYQRTGEPYYMHAPNATVQVKGFQNEFNSVCNYEIVPL